MTNDMVAVTEAKSDQINADDLLGGKRMVVEIAGVTIRPGTEQPITVHLVGHDKVFRPCKTAARVMKAAWGLSSAEYVGKRMELFRDGEVTWGGVEVGGIRISAVSDISQPLVLALQANKKSKKLTTVEVLPVVRDPIDDARDAIKNAANLEALSAVWRNRAMAPFREVLQSTLDDRKAALTHELKGRADADMGEAQNDMDDDLREEG